MCVTSLLYGTTQIQLHSRVQVSSKVATLVSSRNKKLSYTKKQLHYKGLSSFQESFGSKTQPKFNYLADFFTTSLPTTGAYALAQCCLLFRAGWETQPCD